MNALSASGAVVFTLLGLAVGSFLTVVASRLPRRESVVRPPSHCPKCGARLRPAELVPLISFLVQRGRCRHCGEPIAPRYLWIEAAAGAGSGALALWLFPEPRLYVLLALLYTGLAATAIDLEHRVIPNRLLAAGAGAIVLALLATGARGLLGAVEGAALLFLLGLVLAVVGRGGFGFGDVKYLGLVGLALGPTVGILALFAAVLLGGLYAALLLGLHRAGRKDSIAFGPFIAAGSLLAPIVASWAVPWYRGLF